MDQGFGGVNPYYSLNNHITIDDSDPQLNRFHSFATSQRNVWPTVDKRLERYCNWNSALKAIAIVQRFVNR